MKALVDRYRMTAMCDIVPGRARTGAQLAGGPDIKTFIKHTDLIGAGICDAVVIATPNYTHKQIAVDALNGGLHVLCEKPMTTNLADARAMVAAVHKSGRVFGIGQQMRYATVYHKARELLKSGAIGELKCMG
jgi:predicted dehydrogenase